MSRSIDTIVAQILGNQVMQIAALTANVEELKEQLEATKQAPMPKPDEEERS